jgi:hypothetical protein
MVIILLRVETGPADSIPGKLAIITEDKVIRGPADTKIRGVD